MASQSDNLEKFLKCLSLYPVAKTILKNITSMETMRALLQLAKETFSGPDQDTIKHLILTQYLKMLLVTEYVTKSEHFTSLETLKSLREMAKVKFSGTDLSALNRSLHIQGSVSISFSHFVHDQKSLI